MYTIDARLIFMFYTMMRTRSKNLLTFSGLYYVDRVHHDMMYPNIMYTQQITLQDIINKKEQRCIKNRSGI
jgi:hypothetical protein